MKRFVATLLAVVMTMSLTIPAYAADDDKYQPIQNETNHDKQEVHGDPENPDIGVGYGESDITIQVTEDEQHCEHTLVYTSNGDGTHDATCDKCKQKIRSNQRCTDRDDNLKCDLCGAAMECQGYNYRYADNGDGTHNKVCMSGGHNTHNLVENEAHVLNAEGTECTLCHATIECEHPEADRVIVSNGKNAEGKYTHSIKCEHCGANIETVECSDTDGDGDLICDTEGCTNKLPCKHEDTDWLGNQEITWTHDDDNPGHHTGLCPDTDCGGTITEECSSADADCTCDKCGHASHDFKWVDDKNNSTHSWKCGVCGKTADQLPEGQTAPDVPEGHTSPEKHIDILDASGNTGNDGYCDVCKFTMSDLGAPIMVAEVPAIIPISATQSGRVTVPTNLAIKNHTNKPLYVDGIQPTLSGWIPTDSSQDLTQLEVPEPQEGYEPWSGYIAINLRGTCITSSTGGGFRGTDWIVQPEDTLPLNVAVKVSPQESTTETPKTIGSIKFSLAWYTGTATSAKDLGVSDQDRFNTGVGETIWTLTITEPEGEKHYRLASNPGEIKTDRWGYIKQLPDIIPDTGYAVDGWYTLDGFQVYEGRRVSRSVSIVPRVSKVSAGTVTFSTEGLPPGVTLEFTSVETGADGRIYKVPAVNNLPSNCKFVAWVTDKGYQVTAGSQFDGDVTLRATFEYNAIDAEKLYAALRPNDAKFTGSIVVNAPGSAVATGDDISTFGNGGIRVTKSGDVATISGADVALPADASRLFAYLPDVTAITIDSGISWSNVTSTREMFMYDNKLNQLNLGSFASTATNITDMGYMFADCWTINASNSVKPLRDMDSSKVQFMDYMYNNCHGLTTVNLQNVETTSLVDMSGMFAGCTNAKIFDFTGWNTSKVEYMNNLFMGITSGDVESSLTTLDLSMFDTSHVTRMDYMFQGCTYLQGLNVVGWNVSNVTDMDSMFADITYISTIDLTGWSIGSDCYIDGMFANSNKTVTGLSTGDMTRIRNEGKYNPLTS